MSAGLADTSVFIANESGRPLRLDLIPEQLGVSIVTIGELRAGVLAASDVATRAQRLSTLTGALRLDPLPVDESVAESCANLRILLRDNGKRMPVSDSWMAATPMALGVPVVTQDDDYVRVPGLDVICV